MKGLTEKEVDELLAGLRKDLLACKSVQIDANHGVKHEYASPGDPNFAKHWGRPIGMKRVDPKTINIVMFFGEG